MNQLVKTDRIHSLDALRAVMMLLGVVIHSSLTYGTLNYGEAWPLKDANANSIVFDWLGDFIHRFRMPVFFVVAGFFGALLYYERSPRKMLINRLKRVGLPFVLFVIILWPAVGISFGFSIEALDPTANAEEAINDGLPIFIPRATFHLWFLYYLMMISVLVMALASAARYFPVVGRILLKRISEGLDSPWLRLSGGTIIIFLILFVIDQDWPSTSISFIPEPKTLLFYGVLYLLGWGLFHCRTRLAELSRHAGWHTLAGALLYTVLFFEWQGGSEVLRYFLSALTGWLLTIGITGLFIRFAGRSSKVMRYLSDASYWVYLIHLPFTIFLPGLLVDWQAPAVVKFFSVMIITATVCLMSYHFLVRATIIGQFLNGRRYSIRRKKVGEE